MTRFLTFATVIFAFSQLACAHSLGGLRRGQSLESVSPVQWAHGIPRGAVVVLGENHGLRTHRDQHMILLQALREAGHRVSVGLEFFPASAQADVDAWRDGDLSETDFLERIAWGQPSFDFYRDQALFPRLGEDSRTLALNASRALTSRVAKVGIEGLNASERAHLPPGFTLGRESYRARFLALMPHLPNPQAGERYFAAQSVWDDTMAFHGAEFLTKAPDQTLVVIVGDFHVQYGGGLPDRLRARTQVPVVTVSQVDLTGLSPSDAAEALAPDALYGVRADFVWGAESPTIP